MLVDDNSGDYFPIKRKESRKRWWRFRVTWNPHVIAFADWHKKKD